MILTKDNTDATIVAALSGKIGKGLKFWDAKTGKVFMASPCDSCGTMTAHGGEVTIERVSDALNRALSEYYSTGVEFVECVGYDEETGEEICEECG